MALGHQACRCLGKSLRQGTGENRGPEGGPGLQAATRRQLWLEHRKGDRQGQHGSPLGLFILTVTETTGGLRIREQHKLKLPGSPTWGQWPSCLPTEHPAFPLLSHDSGLFVCFCMFPICISPRARAVTHSLSGLRGLAHSPHACNKCD